MPMLTAGRQAGHRHFSEATSHAQHAATSTVMDDARASALGLPLLKAADWPAFYAARR